MSRWPRAAGLLPGDKTDKTDKTHAMVEREGVNTRGREVLSVKSVLSPRERAEPPGPPPEAVAGWEAIEEALADFEARADIAATVADTEAWADIEEVLASFAASDDPL